MPAPARHRHPKPARSPQVDLGWVLLLALFVLSLPLVTPRLYAVDSAEYFAYLPSLLFDGDLDFTDEYTYLHELNPDAGIQEGLLDKRDPTTGLPLNIAPVGTALLWAPAYLLVHGGVLVARAAGATVAADGLSRPYILAVCYASAAYAFVGLLLCYRLARRYASSFAAALAVAVVWLATPAFFYSHASPPWSHSTSLFAVALFVNVWHDTRGRRTTGQFLLLGLLAGLVALVREQDSLFLLIPAVEGLVALIQVVRRRAWRELFPLVGRYLLLLVGAAVAWSPQLAVYRVLNGRFGPNPTVAGKMTWWSPYFFQVLGNPHYGLLVWCPAVLLALVGLVLLWKRDRLLAAVFGTAFLAQVYITGAYLTWMGPGSFGPRRFINCSVIFVLGLAMLVGWAREKRVPAWVLAGVGAVLVAWNIGLVANWVLYADARQAGLVWRDLPRRIFWEIPRQGLDLLRRLLFDRGSLVKNPGQ
jgi:hypothetical protein